MAVGRHKSPQPNEPVLGQAVCKRLIEKVLRLEENKDIREPAFNVANEGLEAPPASHRMWNKQEGSLFRSDPISPLGD